MYDNKEVRSKQIGATEVLELFSKAVQGLVHTNVAIKIHRGETPKVQGG
jgi:hypothetical protein